jgi:hypothetical protein
MWADTAIAVLALIAVHAKNLESARESLSLQPFVNIVMSRFSLRLSMQVPIIVYMVNGQKKRFQFSAASANLSIMIQHSSLCSLVPESL